MSAYSFWGAIELGLVYGLVALGVFISFRILRFPDLTVDGSFPLGAACAATLITSGVSPFLATLIAMAVGAFAGMITAWLNVKLKIMDLLASILMMTALYSVNLRIMGSSNVPLINDPTIFRVLEPESMYDSLMFKSAVLFIIVVAMKLLLDWFFSTELGLAMRSTGSNPRMARAQGVATGMMVVLGMAISNALVALAGALYAQTEGAADVTMGVGTIVVGLAAVIIGERMLPSRKLVVLTLAVILGSILYRFFIAFALNANAIGLNAQDLNLITAVLVTVVLVLPLLKRRRNGKHNHDNKAL